MCSKITLEGMIIFTIAVICYPNSSCILSSHISILFTSKWSAMASWWNLDTANAMYMDSSIANVHKGLVRKWWNALVASSGIHVDSNAFCLCISASRKSSSYVHTSAISYLLVWLGSSVLAKTNCFQHMMPPLPFPLPNTPSNKIV